MAYQYAGMIRRPTKADIAYLAEHMAEEDKRETLAAGHISVLAGVQYSVLASRDAWAWVVDDRVVCMFGIGGDAFLGADEFHPWLLSTPEVRRLGRDFLRGCKVMVENWRRRYGRMSNLVDARHTRAVRWVRWLGFEVLPAVPIGRDGVLFHPFKMEALDAAA